MPRQKIQGASWPATPCQCRCWFDYLQPYQNYREHGHLELSCAEGGLVVESANAADPWGAKAEVHNGAFGQSDVHRANEGQTHGTNAEHEGSPGQTVSWAVEEQHVLTASHLGKARGVCMNLSGRDPLNWSPELMAAQHST